MPREGHKVANKGDPGQHLDYSAANVHYPGLLIVDANNNERRTEPLLGRASFTGEGGSQKPPVSNFKQVVGLDSVNNNNSTSDLELIPFNDFAFVAVALSFKGGKMDHQKDSKFNWNVDRRFNPQHPHHDIPFVLTQVWTWHRPVDIVIVAPDGKETRERLTDGEQAYIYNFDVETPTVKQLEAEEECPKKGEALDDVDFNWLYQLVVPKDASTLTKRMDGKELPRPKSTCPGGFLTPRTSTCFGGKWGG
jgi:hypothetical protein